MDKKDRIEIPEGEARPDVIAFLIHDTATSISALSEYLAYLDDGVYGYQDEEFDEYGDNPEVYEVAPYLTAFDFEYKGLRKPGFRVAIKRDEDLEEVWHRHFAMLSQLHINIDTMSAYRQRDLIPSEPHFSQYRLHHGGMYVSYDFDHNIPSLYGIDWANHDDRVLAYQWLSDLFKGTMKDSYVGSLGGLFGHRPT